MVWLDPNEFNKQKYLELRLYASKKECIWLEFNPLKMSDASDWNPKWEEWHCYANPLRIYQQDFERLLQYFDKIYPIKDAFTGTDESAFDVCFDNWIGKEDWLKLINEIEADLECFTVDEKQFFTDFLGWTKTALENTSIIVVEGNQ